MKCYFFCKKTVSIKGDKNRMSISQSIDEDLYAILLLNLVDSLSDNWYTFSRNRFLNLGIKITHISCVVITNVTLSHAKKIDDQLQALEYFIGAATTDYGNPLHSTLFYEYLTRSVYTINNEILYSDAMDIVNWDSYYPSYTMRYVEDFVFDSTARDIWKENLSVGGLESSHIIINKVGNYHHVKVGHAIIRAVFEGKIDREFELEINYPNAELAIVIPRQKLEKYALDLAHPEEGPKAKYFKDVLSIEQRDWSYMEEQIRLGIHEGEVCGIKIDEHGIKYYADIGVTGLNGVNKVIRTAWIIRKNGPIQLTSVYPLDLKEQFDVNYEIRPLLAVSKENEKEGGDKWGEIYRLANQSGEFYASKCIPTPVFVSGTTEPMHDGLFGWAYVVLYDLNHEFVSWLKINRVGSSYENNYLINIDKKGRYEESVAFAEGFCKVLKSNRIDCEIIKHLD